MIAFLKIVISLFLLAVSFIPEIGGYLLWDLLNPTTFIERAIIIAIYIFGGVAFSLAIKFFCFSAFVYIVSERW